MLMQPFDAKPGGTVSVAATAVTANSPAFDSQSKQVLVTNVGTQLAYVRLKFAGNTTAATGADVPILPNSKLLLTKAGGAPDGGETLAAVIAPGGAGSTIYFTPGDGLMV